MTVDLNQLSVKEHLLVGFYGGKSVGAAGVTGVTLTISANGSTLVNESFGTAAAAVTWFTNHAVDLGALTAPLYASGTLNLVGTLTVTSKAAGSGFYGNMLIGDPPSAETSAAAHHAAAPADAFHFPADSALPGAEWQDTTAAAPHQTASAPEQESDTVFLHHDLYLHAFNGHDGDHLYL